MDQRKLSLIQFMQLRRVKERRITEIASIIVAHSNRKVVTYKTVNIVVMIIHVENVLHMGKLVPNVRRKIISQMYVAIVHQHLVEVKEVVLVNR